MILLLILSIFCCQSLALQERIKTSTSPSVQVKAVQGLITRLLGPKYVSLFLLNVESESAYDTDYYILNHTDSQIQITGRTGDFNIPS